MIFHGRFKMLIGTTCQRSRYKTTTIPKSGLGRRSRSLQSCKMGLAPRSLKMGDLAIAVRWYTLLGV